MLGRYLQSDPIGLAGGVNTFGYALQDPNFYHDFDGLDSRARILAYIGRGDVKNLKNIKDAIGNPQLKTIVENAITKLETPASQLIKGSLQRSKSFHSELGGKTYAEIIKLSRNNSDKGMKRIAQQMKKLIEQQERIGDKIRSCPR